MTYEFIKVESDGRLAIITLNRPEAMNALHGPAHRELGQAFDAFAADPELWAAVITGAGDRSFSAGNDLKASATGGDTSVPASGFAGLTTRYDLTKPVIAAVNGIAMGGGFEIALAADLIVAADNAVFALPEPRVGLAALAGGLHRLPRAIGLKAAMGMILTARRVSAEEGLRLGFVHQVVPQADVLAAARTLALQICELGPMSIRASKEAVMRGLDEATLADAIRNQWSYPAVKALMKSEDLREGPRAFAEKRPPQWKGR